MTGTNAIHRKQAAVVTHPLSSTTIELPVQLQCIQCLKLTNKSELRQDYFLPLCTQKVILPHHVKCRSDECSGARK